MDPTILDKRPLLPSILTIYRPIEEYWESFKPGGARGPDPEQVLDPFDALLIHHVLDLCPGLPVLVDLAAGVTAGASSLIGLTHPHVRRVVVVSEGESRKVDRASSALRAYVRSHPPGLAPLDVVSLAEMPASLTDQAWVVILADAKAGSAEALADRIRLYLDALPDALVLLLGVGRVGDCPALESLVRLCSTGSGRRFLLIRELGEVLAASHLGMVARHDHPHTADILLRLQLLYTGNYTFLDLLQSLNLSAIRAAKVDDDVMKVHWTAHALRAEADEQRRAAHEAREQAAAANHALSLTWAELDALQRAHLPFLARVRRKLAPGVAGKLWRVSKRVGRKCLSVIR